MPENQDFANPTQERVHRRLGLLGAGPATFFRDACRLMAEPAKLATTTHLIGHLLREIEGNLLDVLYEQLVAVPPTVTAEPSPDLVPPSSPPPTEQADALDPRSGDQVPPEAVSEGGAEKKDGHKTKVRAILNALGIAEDTAAARQWIKMAGGEKRLHRVAHRNRLNPPRPVTSVFVDDFNAIVELVDVVLERFEARYGHVYARLDDLLTRPVPGADGIRLLSEAMPNTPRTLAYFFARLQHVGWLEPLRGAGFFRALPPPEIDAEGQALQVHWSAAEYLARVATARPNIVASILEEVAVEPENVRAQGQVIEIMLVLRPEDRVRLAAVVKRLAPGLRRRFWGDQVVAFTTALAQDGAVDLALEMAALVLDLPAPDADSSKRTPQAAEYGRDREERAWDLREAGAPLVSALRTADGVRALTLFADALDYHAGRRPADIDADPTTPEGLEDYSRTWADDFGRREGRTTGDLRLFLAQATLSTVQELGQTDPSALEHLLRILRARGARVLRRIELAALVALLQSEKPGMAEVALPLAVERLTERALMLEDDLAPEWGALLAAAFTRLGKDDRSRVVDALEPPDFPWIQDEEHLASRKASWRRDRLAIIAEHLGPDGTAQLAALIAAEGTPEQLRHGGPRITTWVGPTSPLDPTALADMGADQVVAFLREWKPQGGFAEASPEGLGRQLAKLIEDRPSDYAAWAPRFVGLAPTYVRSFFDGFTTALRAGRPFPWADILQLAEWIVAQPTPASDLGDSSFDADNDWRGARRVVADLVGLGLGLGWGEDGMIPISESGRLWRLISSLSGDPNPSPEYEEQYGGTNMDPSTLAINTTRPEAIDAAIRYAFWVAMQKAQSDRDLATVLDTSPEVARLLEWHLDTTNDPSLAVRAAIGRWLGSLARTDAEWVRSRLPMLLPEAQEAHAQRDALWDTYVRLTQPHPDALPVLEPHYRAAIERVGATRGTRDRGKEADDRLAEHIITLYWWGAANLADPDGLIRFFFASADPARRKHAIHFVGFSLYHTQGLVDQAPLERLRRLWEWRMPQLEAVIAAPGGRERDAVAAARAELEEFGWWFASGVFDPTWALTHLHRVLSLTGGVDLDHAVAERLAELGRDHPLEALRCLSVIDFTGGSEPWSVIGCLEHTRTVIGHALSSDDGAVRAEAKALVNRIVAAGHLDFRSFLNDQ